jgi:hypothetical protein
MTNVTLTIIDGGEEGDQFVFSLKFVEPPITMKNRIVKYTYTDITFQATLWTKRGIQHPYSTTQSYII